jgi:predicted RNA binding protein YcfA (HicA-like mRNA interferase family)
MKLPRGLTGAQLARALSQVGYRVTRQTGSHVRLMVEVPRQHPITFLCMIC